MAKIAQDFGMDQASDKYSKLIAGVVGVARCKSSSFLTDTKKFGIHKIMLREGSQFILNLEFHLFYGKIYFFIRIFFSLKKITLFTFKFKI